jgi:DNA-directed RNA polymerase subunit RPC12/RpoP
MPKDKAKQNICPECGMEVKDPYKTWELVAPIPDKKMRITVTIFGMYQCTKCGKKFKGIVGKAKLGAEGIEI